MGRRHELRVHLAVGEDELVDLEDLQLGHPLERGRQLVRGLDQRVEQLAQLELDHRAPLRLHALQVRLEVVDPTLAPRRLLVQPVPHLVDVDELHLEQELVRHLVEDRLDLLVVQREQLLEAATRVPRARLERHLHGGHLLAVRLDRSLVLRLPRDLHLLDPGVVRARLAQQQLAVRWQRLHLSHRQLVLIERRHVLALLPRLERHRRWEVTPSLLAIADPLFGQGREQRHLGREGVAHARAGTLRFSGRVALVKRPGGHQARRPHRLRRYVVRHRRGRADDDGGNHEGKPTRCTAATTAMERPNKKRRYILGENCGTNSAPSGRPLDLRCFIARSVGRSDDGRARRAARGGRRRGARHR